MASNFFMSLFCIRNKQQLNEKQQKKNECLKIVVPSNPLDVILFCFTRFMNDDDNTETFYSHDISAQSSTDLF